MAIQSNGELEVVLRDVILKVDQTLHQRHCPPLEGAARDLKALAAQLKRKEKPSPQQVKSLISASVAVRDNLQSDEIFDRMLDIEDFLSTMT